MSTNPRHTARRTTRSALRLAGAAAALGLVGSSCSDSAPKSSPPTTALPGRPGTDGLPDRPAVDLTKLQLVADVSTAGDCDALLAKLREVGDAHVGPYGFGYAYGGGVSSGGFRESAGAEDKSVAAPSQGTDSGAAQGVDHSGTNNQELGVDESDLVKTDGRLMVIARGDRLVVVDVSGGPDAARQVASIALPDPGSAAIEGGESQPSRTIYPSGGSAINDLFFDGTHVMAIGQRYQPWPTQPPSPLAEEKGAVPAPVTDPAAIAQSMPGPRTVVHLVDLTDPASPKVTDTAEIDGTLSAARLVEGRARLVVRSEPLALPFVQPQSLIGEQTAEEMNRRVLAEAPLEQWVPHLWRGGERRDLVQCDKVWVPATFAGLSMTSVVTVPLAAATVEPTTASLLAPGDITYTSTGNVYVTAQAWIDPQISRLGQMPEISDWKTAVHQFSIAGDTASYVASGVVPGVIRNSFSMGEVAGHLGVATTTGVPWSVNDQSSSQLVTLKADGDKLVTAGSVSGMGAGESIYSVRYVGTRAYVVTFRQTDPFYVVDLSDPASPKLTGELKITGYSGYLHPVSDTRILGIGRAADAQGRDEGMKATLFDTSDPASPKELGTWTDRNGWSDVEWDHHAFLYWDPTKLAVFPQSNGADNRGPEMVGLRVGDGLSEVGRVRITPPADKGATQCRKLTPAEIEGLTGKDASYSVPGDGFIQVCDPGQAPGASGYQCYDVSAEQIGAATGQPSPPTGAAPGQIVQMCNETFQQPIQRSIVVGSTLWVLAGDVLQANDLDTLASGRQIRVS